MLVIWNERANPRRARAGTESAVTSSPAKRLVRPRTSSRTLFILAEEQSREAAPQEKHRQHQERPEDQLPVLRPARESVLDQQERKGAEHRPGDARHAPKYDHEHKLARARPVHELGRKVRGVVDEQRSGEP